MLCLYMLLWWLIGFSYSTSMTLEGFFTHMFWLCQTRNLEGRRLWQQIILLTVVAQMISAKHRSCGNTKQGQSGAQVWPQC